MSPAPYRYRHPKVSFRAGVQTTKLRQENDNLLALPVVDKRFSMGDKAKQNSKSGYSSESEDE